MRVTKAHKWPSINVEAMRTMKRGRDKDKPESERYSGWMGSAATKMPCGKEYHETAKNESKSRATESAKNVVDAAGSYHIKNCDKPACKEARNK
jgi:hypothetical protein